MWNKYDGNVLCKCANTTTPTTNTTDTTLMPPESTPAQVNKVIRGYVVDDIWRQCAYIVAYIS